MIESQDSAITKEDRQQQSASERADPVALPVDRIVEPMDNPLRPHVYDGIQEYDNRLPNWWLFTLYAAIAYAVIYWVVFHKIGNEPNLGRAIETEIAESRKAMERNSGVLTDSLFWDMSHDAGIVSAGKATFDTTCASCHMLDLTGQIGPNLKDQGWIHGGNPLAIAATITDGVLAKGMPAWGPILGKQKITELTAYILSLHHKGEPIVPVTGWVPGSPPVVAPDGNH